MNELHGKVAVITGAGSGLGREFVLACAKRGMQVMLADVSDAGMRETVDIITAKFPEVCTARQKTDVAKLEQVEALAQATLDQLGSVHYVFNNAGVALGGLLWEQTEAD